MTFDHLRSLQAILEHAIDDIHLSPYPSPPPSPHPEVVVVIAVIDMVAAVVVAMGERAWRDRCPDMLDSGRARFQVHDFFTAQPVRDASVFLLRVVLHDWPDEFARQILVRLHEAARVPTPRSRSEVGTRVGNQTGVDRCEEDGGADGGECGDGGDQGTWLVIADFVLPLACVDDFGSGGGGDSGDRHGGGDGVEGAETMLACPPLLANLGKGSAQGYWMDLTMQVTFNAQERTLREIVALAASAGWKVVRVARPLGSLFGHIVAVPMPMPMPMPVPKSGSVKSTLTADPADVNRLGIGSVGMDKVDMARSPPPSQAGETERELGVGGGVGVGVGGQVQGVANSRCGTPTFGSRVDLPTFEEAFARFSGASAAGRVGQRASGSGSGSSSGRSASGRGRGQGQRGRGGGRGGGDWGTETEKSAQQLTVPTKKKVPSPLSLRVQSPPPTSSMWSPYGLASPSSPSPSSSPSSPLSSPYRQAFNPGTAAPVIKRTLGSPGPQSVIAATTAASSSRRRSLGGGQAGGAFGLVSPSSPHRQGSTPIRVLGSPQSVIATVSPTSPRRPLGSGGGGGNGVGSPKVSSSSSSPSSSSSFSPRTSQLPVVPRKLSAASPAQSGSHRGLRRTGSTVGFGFGLGAGIGTGGGTGGVGMGIGMGSLFAKEVAEAEAQEERSQAQTPVQVDCQSTRGDVRNGLGGFDVERGGGGTVLAAAAKIERAMTRTRTTEVGHATIREL